MAQEPDYGGEVWGLDPAPTWLKNHYLPVKPVVLQVLLTSLHRYNLVEDHRTVKLALQVLT